MVGLALDSYICYRCLPTEQDLRGGVPSSRPDTRSVHVCGKLDE